VISQVNRISGRKLQDEGDGTGVFEEFKAGHLGWLGRCCLGGRGRAGSWKSVLSDSTGGDL
jgi:hypothetical protein